MQLFNSEKKFGLLVRLFHSTIALLFIVQFYLVYRRGYFPKDAPEKLQYILLHKSFGLMLGGLALLFVAMHFIGKRPPLPALAPVYEKIAARLTHFGLYVVMLLMPLSGYLMSCYSGRTPKLFGIEVPVLVEANKALGGFWYNTHVYASYAVIGLVSLHVLAALKHHFINKDGILKRMF